MTKSPLKHRPCRCAVLRPDECPSCHAVANQERYAHLRGPLPEGVEPANPDKVNVSRIKELMRCPHHGPRLPHQPCGQGLFTCTHDGKKVALLPTCKDAERVCSSCEIFPTLTLKPKPIPVATKPVIEPRPVRTDFEDCGYTWSHYGDDGDLIYALSAIYAVCCSTGTKAGIGLYHHIGARHPYDQAHAAKTIPLLEIQPYISYSSWVPSPVGVKLDTAIRRFFYSKGQLGDHYYNWLALEPDDRLHPWLVTDQPNRVAPVVIGRTARYHGLSFPWRRIVEATKGKNVFVGTRAEHKEFCARYGNLPYYHTPDLLALAQVIAGAELFCGNQSCHRAIAEGLKIPVCVEEAHGKSDAPGPADTHYERPTAWYGTDHKFWAPPLAKFAGTQAMKATPAPIPIPEPTHLGIADPLHATYNPSIEWANDPATIEAHIAAIKQVVSHPPAYLGGSGRGIVTAAEGVLWPSVVVMLERLRAVGCTLPVECWYRGRVGGIRPEQVAHLNVTLIDTDLAGQHHRDSRVPIGVAERGGWEAKVYAITHSRFREVLWLDADLYPVADPTPLFNEAKHGLALWADRSQEAKKVLQWSKVWPTCTTPPEAYFSSGQFVIDREQCWVELSALHWMCQHSDFYFHHALGDQDCMLAAWEACRSTGRDAPVHVLGELIKLPNVKHLYQFDYDGQAMFIHRSGPKMMRCDVPQEWEVAQAFADAIKPRDELAELASIADRSLVPSDRLEVIRDCVLATNHLDECLAEVGVYRGGTAKLIRAFASSDDPLLLFDTFAGMPADDEHLEGHRKGDFCEGASVSEVLEYVGGKGVVPHIGTFPTTAPDGVRYRFVHVDGDITQTIRAAIEYFPSRMVAGGIMVFDDYDAPSCPSVKPLVDGLRDRYRVETPARLQAVVYF